MLFLYSLSHHWTCQQIFWGCLNLQLSPLFSIPKVWIFIFFTHFLFFSEIYLAQSGWPFSAEVWQDGTFNRWWKNYPNHSNQYIHPNYSGLFYTLSNSIWFLLHNFVSDFLSRLDIFFWITFIEKEILCVLHVKKHRENRKTLPRCEYY